ncbi:hypothetical protein OIDMADRAFT_31091 [Oidiodendron maius Zn]|uniref:Uncharacterized protein n=1 Tax=Oidiodendron maius (strain Zn) TaxID=913774 RepID=A0A0C3H777_OIDMZ|nr:hypothetical protein OIDMADRAFT_31091 [Oidiodendron maius Zn]
MSMHNEQQLTRGDGIARPIVTHFRNAGQSGGRGDTGFGAMADRFWVNWPDFRGGGSAFKSLQLQGVAHKIKIFLQYPSHDYIWTPSTINASSIAHQSPENIDPLVNSTAPVSYAILSYEINKTPRSCSWTPPPSYRSFHS